MYLSLYIYIYIAIIIELIYPYPYRPGPPALQLLHVPADLRLSDGRPGILSEAYKRGRIKRGCSQKPDLRIGGKTGPRNMYR